MIKGNMEQRDEREIKGEKDMKEKQKISMKSKESKVIDDLTSRTWCKKRRVRRFVGVRVSCS